METDGPGCKYNNISLELAAVSELETLGSEPFDLCAVLELYPAVYDHLARADICTTMSILIHVRERTMTYRGKSHRHAGTTNPHSTNTCQTLVLVSDFHCEVKLL